MEDKTEAQFIFAYGMILSIISYIAMVMLGKGIMIWSMFFIFFFGLILMIFSVDAIRDLSNVQSPQVVSNDDRKATIDYDKLRKNKK